MATIANLAGVLGTKDLDALTAVERTAYDSAFTGFKAAHATQFPEGQTITLPITSVTLMPDRDANYRLTVKEGPNAYTPVFKFKAPTLDIMFRNALQLNAGVTLSLLIPALNKGALKMTVKVVDETDTYVTKDGIEENYRGPGVARFEGTQVEYVPSAEVTTAAGKAYGKIQDLQLARMLTDMEAPVVNATATPISVPAGDEDEI